MGTVPIFVAGRQKMGLSPLPRRLTQKTGQGHGWNTDSSADLLSYPCFIRVPSVAPSFRCLYASSLIISFVAASTASCQRCGPKRS